jgi:hypothetical protein
MKLRWTSLLLALTLAGGCDLGIGVSDAPVTLAVPDRAGAHVTLASDGDWVAAAWAATGGPGTQGQTDIYAALSVDGGRTFGSPVRVNDVPGDAKANGEQPPRVLVKRAALHVLWVSKRDGVSGILAAASTDGGRTFTRARAITPSGLTGMRGWESATLGADGIVHAVWLDGRNAAPAGAEHHHGDARQDIYHAMWKGGDAPVETSVASDVCFCCKTAVVSRGSDVFVAWRHLFPGGVRDIAVARSADGGRTFGAPVRVSEDNWKIDACPDDGPAMDVDGNGVLRVTWPTLVKDGDTGRIAIFESTSRDEGATFTPRARVDGATGAAAHPRIAIGAGGASAVVWDELAEGSRRVFVRPAGGAPVAVSEGRIASYPAIAAVREGFVIAFTDQADTSSTIRVLRIPSAR